MISSNTIANKFEKTERLLQPAAIQPDAHLQSSKRYQYATLVLTLELRVRKMNQSGHARRV
jgi:hypothetical protein